MSQASHILKIYKKSFCVNLYTNHPFRMIGLINSLIQFPDCTEEVTLAFYSSSGTNNGKTKGAWYPIAGIKTITGTFSEFTPRINHILKATTRFGEANAGWLAKSLFFPHVFTGQIKGFAAGPYYEDLLSVSQLLHRLYQTDDYRFLPTLTPFALNNTLLSSSIYSGNRWSQQDNFENYLYEIYEWIYG